jgi:hypothetical protein
LKLTHKRHYAEARRKFYPEVPDQLDAIWKAIEAIGAQAGVDFPQDVTDQLEKIRNVKAKCPKEGIKKKRNSS